jgi:hypothetical protein
VRGHKRIDKENRGDKSSILVLLQKNRYQRSCAKQINQRAAKLTQCDMKDGRWRLAGDLVRAVSLEPFPGMAVIETVAPGVQCLEDR